MLVIKTMNDITIILQKCAVYPLNLANVNICKLRQTCVSFYSCLCYGILKLLVYVTLCTVVVYGVNKKFEDKKR